MRISQRELAALGVALDTGPPTPTTLRGRRQVIVPTPTAPVIQQDASPTPLQAEDMGTPDQSATKSRLGRPELDSLDTVEEPKAGDRTDGPHGEQVIAAAAPAIQQEVSSTSFLSSLSSMSEPSKTPANPPQTTTKTRLGKRELDSLGVAEEPKAGDDRSDRRLRRQRRAAELAAQELARRHAKNAQAAIQKAAKPAVDTGEQVKEDGKESAITCAVCFERPPDNSARFEACDKPAGYCRVCLQDWLGYRIDEARSVRSIGCPCAKRRCGGYPTCETVFEYATTEAFERFDTLQTREQLLDFPGYRECPSAECRSGQCHDDHDGNIFTCVDCNYRHCTSCDVKFHDGESCEQYTSRRSKAKQEKLSEAAVKKLPTCPNPKCGVPIVKNGGCDSMYCFLCHRSFSWSSLPGQKLY